MIHHAPRFETIMAAIAAGWLLLSVLGCGFVLWLGVQAGSNLRRKK